MTRTVLPCLIGLFPLSVWAVTPAEVVLIVNRNVPESASVAEHYRRLRNVPAENVVTLDLPKTEDISRPDYDEKLVAPLRRALQDRKEQIKVLLCIYGVPLRVGGIEPTANEREEIAALDQQLGVGRQKIKELGERANELESAGSNEAKTVRQQMADEQKRLEPLTRRRNHLAGHESQAAVDNELMLLWWEKYELRRFIVNPLHFRVSDRYRRSKPMVLMTARLDGPDAATSRRLVSDAVEVEKVGLKGKVYVDARGIRFDAKSDSGYGYGGYDESMREMAALLRDLGKLDVVLDDKPELFAAGACPETALYCGWYSLANYVDSFQFVQGAVAWHLASSEAVSLRGKNSKLWCANILKNGACATLGPVAEPYTVGFPMPAEFFGFLVTGQYTLVECYARTLNLTSWMGTLIGDPLYNPFRMMPRLSSDQVSTSPKGSKFLLNEPE